MKRKLLLFLLLFISVTAYTQEQSNLNSFQKENFFYAGKIWGFVKYYHPEARQGRYDMDSLLVVLLDNISKVKDTKHRNAVFNEWIAQFGKIKEYEQFLIKDSSQYKQLYDYVWIKNKAFDKKLSKSLTNIKDAKRTDSCHYAILNAMSVPTFENEKSIIPDFSKKYQKLVPLFRYWNAIEYYFPYKSLTDKRWDSVLKEYIPTFLGAKNISVFDLAVLSLTMDINDGHSMCLSDARLNVRYPYKKYRSPIKFVYAKNKFLVNGLWYYMKNSGKLSDYGMELGDELVAVNGRDPKEIIRNDVSNYFGSSNFNELCNSRNEFLLQSDTTFLEITYKRDSQVFSNKINTSRFVYRPVQPVSNEGVWIKDNIAYIDISFACKDKLIEMISEIKNTKGAIIDMRGYASACLLYDIATFFSSESPTYAKMSEVDPANPGNFELTIAGNYRCFPVRMNNYDGKLVVLVDYNTYSNSEFNTMRLQVLPDVITIGSQTAGIDGNIAQLPLHNDLRFGFSSLGVYYPDGGETQRIGLRIDEEVYPTPQGLKEGRDEVIERAIEIINTK